IRRHGRDARHALAEICARCPRLPAQRQWKQRCKAAHRRGDRRLSAQGQRGDGDCGRVVATNNHKLGAGMDFALNDKQRSWQMLSRKFADEEIRPISLERDAIPTARETWTWDIIKKGSKLGFRTMAVPKKYGGQETDFVTQALVMTELAKADS